MCVAIAATVATVATTAYGAYAASSAKSDAANIPAPKHKGYTAVEAKDNPFAGTENYLTAVNQFGGAANQAANQENNWYQQSINALAPGTTHGISTASKQANQFLRGDIPSDVQASIQRASAQGALNGGFDAGSGMGRNLNTRDLGLESLDLQQRGLSQLGTTTNLAKSLTPFGANDFLGSQAGYQSDYNSFAQYNASQQNQAAAATAGAANYNADAQYAQQTGAALAPSPYASAATAAAGSFSAYYNNQAAQNNGFNNYAQPYDAGYGATGISYTPGWYSYSGGVPQGK